MGWSAGPKITWFYLHDLDSVLRLSACSHLVHTRSLSLPACGVRLEIAPQSHKKISELYFAFQHRKTLTKNHRLRGRRFPRWQSFSQNAVQVSARFRANESLVSAVAFGACRPRFFSSPRFSAWREMPRDVPKEPVYGHQN
jgi:hypothetical protein